MVVCSVTVARIGTHMLKGKALTCREPTWRMGHLFSGQFGAFFANRAYAAKSCNPRGAKGHFPYANIKTRFKTWKDKKLGFSLDEAAVAAGWKTSLFHKSLDKRTSLDKLWTSKSKISLVKYSVFHAKVVFDRNNDTSATNSKFNSR